MVQELSKQALRLITIQISWVVGREDRQPSRPVRLDRHDRAARTNAARRLPPPISDALAAAAEVVTM